jgi:hypothetical protein
MTKRLFPPDITQHFAPPNWTAADEPRLPRPTWLVATSTNAERVIRPDHGPTLPQTSFTGAYTRKREMDLEANRGNREKSTDAKLVSR